MAQSYDFGAMKAYIAEMLDKEKIEDEDCVFTLVPVQVNFETTSSGSYYYPSSSQVVSEVLPYLTSPVAAVVNLDEAKIKFTYSLQSQK